MRITFLIIIFTVLSASSSSAVLFHDCDTDPWNLAQSVHEEHGGNCGNTTEEGMSTNSDCTASCEGYCPLGEWFTNMDCSVYSFDYSTCFVSGNIVCGLNRTPRTYSLACTGGQNTIPGVAATRESVTCGNTTCDCNTSPTAWDANCS